MKQLFRGQLSNTELLTRLFATADKTGIYADAAIYGQGLMDLGTATRTVGTARVTAGARVDDPGHDIQATRLQPGDALGDALAHSLAGREIVAFDALGAPFWYRLSDTVHPGSARSAGGLSLASRVRTLMEPEHRSDAPAGEGWSFAAGEPPADRASSLLNLARDPATLSFRTGNGLKLSAFTTEGGKDEQIPRSGAMLAWRSSDRPFAMRFGWLSEPQAVLGSTGGGAWGELSADSFAVGFETETELAGWRVGADAELGRVRPQASGTIVTGWSDLTTSAFSLRAARFLTEDDEIGFSVSQPVRVEHGRANLTVPIGRTRDGAVLHESSSVGLSPSGRQLDSSISRRAGAGPGCSGASCGPRLSSRTIQAMRTPSPHSACWRAGGSRSEPESSISP